jgi:hypothetical protein
MINLMDYFPNTNLGWHRVHFVCNWGSTPQADKAKQAFDEALAGGHVALAGR